MFKLKIEVVKHGKSLFRQTIDFEETLEVSLTSLFQHLKFLFGDGSIIIFSML